MIEYLKILGRKKELFSKDLENYQKFIADAAKSSKILVVGGAGSIGSELVKLLYSLSPSELDVVDINENGLAELVRDIRSSSIQVTDCILNTYVLDVASPHFESFMLSKKYDYICNLSALKHVRSEKNVFTLSRMIEVNIFNAIKLAKFAKKHGTKKYFCVSTDKAANPVNLMGASKRIMEKFLTREAVDQKISLARFANVAFSSGSLLDSFIHRFHKMQPIIVPGDVFRYFITPKESGLLCLFSCFLAENLEIFFPKDSSEIVLQNFRNIAVNFLNSKGFEPNFINDEYEAKKKFMKLYQKNKWPVLISKSDTTGEKSYEEFFTSTEQLDLKRYNQIGIVSMSKVYSNEDLNQFEYKILNCIELNKDKTQIVNAINELLPELRYFDIGKYLDEKM